MKYKRSFRSLIVWQEAKELCLKIYNQTQDFPKSETYGLCSQLRRSSSSIMANIAEGNGRRTTKDKLRFYNIAFSSLTETDCLLELSEELSFIKKEEYNKTVNNLNKTAYLLSQLVKKLREP